MGIKQVGICKSVSNATSAFYSLNSVSILETSNGIGTRNSDSDLRNSDYGNL